MLGSILAEVCMTHHYVHFLDKKRTRRGIVEAFDDHVIAMRRRCKFLGLIPYSRNMEVGRIETEPESARPYSNGHFPRYGKVMQIAVTDSIAEEPLMSIGQRISDKLNADVDILGWY